MSTLSSVARKSHSSGRLPQNLSQFDFEMCPDLVFRQSIFRRYEEYAHLDVVQKNLPGVASVARFGVWFNTTSGKRIRFLIKPNRELCLSIDPG
jgi:hypothetical protein